MDEDFEASTMSDGLLDRKPRKRAVNLALSLEDLFKGGTKKLKVGVGQGRRCCCKQGERRRAGPGSDGGGGIPRCEARAVV
jgi:hypothetical protein